MPSGQGSDLGDTLWFASLAYLLVLLPWTVAFAHDFISEKWATIEHTRSSGRWHVGAILVLAPVLLAYIVLQPMSSEPDHKEMYTALTALIVGTYHLLRSCIGLIQLDRFQDWATTTATLMEQGSYRCELQKFNAEIQAERGVQKLPRRGPVFKRVRKMGVNNSIVDNEFTSSKSPNVAFSLNHWFANVMGRRLPLEAKFTTFVRWSVAFLAQFGDKWLKDVSGTALMETGLRRTRKRREFAVKVLAAATLRMGRTEVQDDVHPSCFCGLDLGPHKSNLPPNAWQQISNRSDAEDVVFSMEEFATASFRTQTHMPGRTPILHLTDKSPQDAQRDIYTLLEPGFLDPLIEEARSSLHPTLHERLEKHESFSARHLKWFAAFLWTQSVIQGDTRKRWFARFMESGVQDDSSEGIGITETWKRRTIDLSAENDTALRLLRSQLGFEDSVMSRTFFYPFLQCAYERRFWDNRAILDVSLRIDNWLAISGGRQVSFLCQKERYWGQDKFWSAHGDSNDTYPRIGSDFSHGMGRKLEESEDHSSKQSQKLFRYHQELEIAALKYQLADMHTNHWHMEHGITFLGCIAESVRSALAEQVYLNDAPFDNWCPELPRDSVIFFPSTELQDCVYSKEKFDSAIQERMLWECQQGVYSSLCKKIEQSMDSGSFQIQREIETMLLFVMGFPSIEVTQRWPGEPNIFIRPVLAPQPLEVRVVLYAGKSSPSDRTKSTAVLRLETWSEEGSNWKVPRQFWWRDWRDAFEGRLEGRYLWQEQHFLPACHIRKSDRHETLAKPTEPLGGNATWEKPPRVWSGWKPFRRGMALFEMKQLLSSAENDDSEDQDQLSFDDQVIPDHQEKLIRRQKSSAKTYSDSNVTTSASLSAAMLRLDTLLRHGEWIDNLFETLNKFRVDQGHPSGRRFGHRRRSLIQHALRVLRGHDEDEDPPDNTGSRSKDEILAAIRRLAKDARDFKPDAMHRLADDPELPSISTRDLAFQLKQGLLYIDRDTETAKYVIDKLLTKSAGLTKQRRREGVDAARYAVELLWLDIEAKHRKIWKKHTRKMTEQEVLRWKKELRNEEKQRMAQVIDLHLTVVKADPTGTMLKDLAERISKWGNTKKNEEQAIRLYESAIIANADPEPMIRLATLHASRNFDKDNVEYARGLLQRALRVATTEPHAEVMDGSSLHIKTPGDVLLFLYKLATDGDRGAKWLHDDLKILKQLDQFGGADDTDSLAEHLTLLKKRAALGDQIAQQFFFKHREDKEQISEEDFSLVVKTE